MSREGLHNLSGEGVNQPDEGPVGGNEDGLAVRRKLQPRPVQVLLGCKGENGLSFCYVRTSSVANF